MDTKRVGKKLQGQRKAFGIKAEDLADLCHINVGYLRQIESGCKIPSLPLLVSLCEQLKITPNYLLEYTDEGEKEEVWKRIYRLTPKERELLIWLLDSVQAFRDQEAKGE